MHDCSRSVHADLHHPVILVKHAFLVAIKLQISNMSYFGWIAMKWFRFMLFCNWSIENSFAASPSCSGSEHFPSDYEAAQQSVLVLEHEAHVCSRRAWNVFSGVSEFWDRLAESLILLSARRRYVVEDREDKILKRADSERFVCSTAHKAAIVSEISKRVVCWEVVAVAVSSIIQLLVFYLLIYLFY